MGPSPLEVVAILSTIAIPAFLVFYLAKRWFGLKEKRLEIDATLAAEKAAQYAVANQDLAARVRVLEQIVTDRGIDTAAQIEALRAPRLSKIDELN